MSCLGGSTRWLLLPVGQDRTICFICECFCVPHYVPCLPPSVCSHERMVAGVKNRAVLHTVSKFSALAGCVNVTLGIGH